jgi:plastocyanin
VELRRENVRVRTRLQRAIGMGVSAVLSMALFSGCMVFGQGPTVPVIRIPRGQSVFAPFIVSLVPGTTVIWTNQDAISHRVLTTPDRTAYLNPTPLALTIPAGGTIRHTFTVPGVYDYYDPALATWNATDHRVAAHQGLPSFPLAMEGVIYVQGAIAGVPEGATNPIPGKDEFQSDFLAVVEGGSVAWYNADTDEHFITPVPGWSDPINPTDLGATPVEGTHGLPPNGETATIIFLEPGLYYVYCSAHAHLNPTWHRAAADAGASEYPIPMEAFVLVVPTQ